MSEPRVFHALQRAHAALFRTADRVLARDGLSASQLGVLFVLREMAESSVSGLARTLGLGKPAVSGLIDRMAAAGFVARMPRADDRRGDAIVLTPHGSDLALRHEATTRHFNAALLDGFDKAERATILRFLDHVTASAEALAESVPANPSTRKDPE